MVPVWFARPEEKRLSPSKGWRSDECSTAAEIAEANKAIGAIRARANRHHCVVEASGCVLVITPHTSHLAATTHTSHPPAPFTVAGVVSARRRR